MTTYTTLQDARAAVVAQAEAQAIAPEAFEAVVDDAARAVFNGSDVQKAIEAAAAEHNG